MLPPLNLYTVDWTGQQIETDGTSQTDTQGFRPSHAAFENYSHLLAATHAVRTYIYEHKSLPAESTMEVDVIWSIATCYDFMENLGIKDI